MRKVICVFLLTVGLAFGAYAGDESCDRYVQGEGSELSIKHDCVLQQELPPLFVQKSDEGTLEILVTRTDTAEGEALWQATQDWLADEGNLRDLIAQIQFAADLAKSDRMVIDGNHSQIESINTNNVPEAAGIAHGDSRDFAENGVGNTTMSTNGCRDIPVCTACKVYYCGQIGGTIYCNCRWWGSSCCVIDLQI
jgi:hypothetical protein